MQIFFRRKGNLAVLAVSTLLTITPLISSQPAWSVDCPGITKKVFVNAITKEDGKFDKDKWQIKDSATFQSLVNLFKTFRLSFVHEKSSGSQCNYELTLTGTPKESRDQITLSTTINVVPAK